MFLIYFYACDVSSNNFYIFERVFDEGILQGVKRQFFSSILTDMKTMMLLLTVLCN